MNVIGRLQQSPKETSYAYGDEYQEQMLRYYHEGKAASSDNQGYLRTRLVIQLIEDAFQRLDRRTRQETVVVDVGCSVGTFAIECAKMGFSSHGVDFDPQAITIAERLNREEQADAQFHVMDVSDWPAEFPPVDIAVCADIFEHLHDDELGALLVSLRKNLRQGGLLVFHTSPQEYDYIFWRKKGDVGLIDLRWFIRPFKMLSDEYFTRFIRIVALAYDIVSVALKGATYKERIKRADHPNPLTKLRLNDLFNRAGYEILTVDTSTFDVQMRARHAAFFRSHSVTHRSLYGIARPRVGRDAR
jgi:SAM-dependent methyltransferase